MKSGRAPNLLVPTWRQATVPSANKSNRVCDGQAQKRANDCRDEHKEVLMEY